MRISDWSSDVCSSDLEQADHVVGRVARSRDETSGGASCKVGSHQQHHRDQLPLQRKHGMGEGSLRGYLRIDALCPPAEPVRGQGSGDQAAAEQDRGGRAPVARHLADQQMPAVEDRSEEHTSELQSLMRISYAVFCLKKKKETADKRYDPH